MAIRRVGQALAILLISLVSIEILLQIGGLVMRDRAERAWREGASVRILSVGDSHTYGAGVQPGEDYPAQLQRFLDQREPGRFSVINIGIPGLNTAQAANRFETNLARWNPDILVFWCGVNNVWNNAEREGASLGVTLDIWAMRLRSYKLVKVWLHERRLGEGKAVIEDGREAILPAGEQGHQTLFGEIHPVFRDETATDDATREWIARDLAAMAESAIARGIEVALVTYPLDHHPTYAMANRAIRAAAAQVGAPVIDGIKGHERVPDGVPKQVWTMHPTAPVYREIARDVAQVILSLDGRRE